MWRKSFHNDELRDLLVYYAECFKKSFTTSKLMQIYAENIYSVLNCHSIAKLTEFLSGIVTVQCDFH
jgi:hypothetical protein